MATTRCLALTLVIVSVVIMLYRPSLAQSPGNETDESRYYGHRRFLSMRHRYENWLQRYRKRDKLTGTEWQYRFGIYQANVQFIDRINLLNLSFKLADNKFADTTNKEFRQTYLGLRQRRHIAVNHDMQMDEYETFDKDNARIPLSVDWRRLGAVTPVKNQGRCGSCWAFSAVAAVEGINKLKTGKLVSLSTQELVDCARGQENDGCKGGTMDQAFMFITRNRGITMERHYPYVGRDNSCNRVNQTNRVVSIKGYLKVMPNNETSLMVAASRQPVSVAIDAGSIFFQLYSKGIMTGSFCGHELDHGVTVVGYGEESGTKYWLVKNSWSSKWGEDGYMRINRGKSGRRGACGIAMDASYPLK